MGFSGCPLINEPWGLEEQIAQLELDDEAGEAQAREAQARFDKAMAREKERVEQSASKKRNMLSKLIASTTRLAEQLAAEPNPLIKSNLTNELIKRLFLTQKLLSDFAKISNVIITETTEISGNVSREKWEHDEKDETIKASSSESIDAPTKKPREQPKAHSPRKTTKHKRSIAETTYNLTEYLTTYHDTASKTVREVWDDPVEREPFKNYCRRIFAFENVMFLEDLEVYDAASLAERVVLAMRLWKTYFDNKSNNTINVTHLALVEVQRAVVECIDFSSEIALKTRGSVTAEQLGEPFELSRKEIWSLLESDTLNKYKRDLKEKELLRKLNV